MNKIQTLSPTKILNLQDSSDEQPLPELTLEQQFKPQISPIAAAFIGLIGGFFLYQIVGGLLTLLIFGLDVENAPVNGIRLMTMAGQILFILLPALLFTKLLYADVTKFFRIKIPSWKEVLFIYNWYCNSNDSFAKLSLHTKLFHRSAC